MWHVSLFASFSRTLGMLFAWIPECFIVDLLLPHVKQVTLTSEEAVMRVEG
jgi:hypothetical protein